MKHPFVNVTLPVHNEERILAASVGEVLTHLERECPGPFEVIIADNGSTDRTTVIAHDLAAKHGSIRVDHSPEAGRGGALKRVWLASEADILSYMDVDLSTDLAAFAPMLRKLMEGCDLVVASRRLPGSVVRRSLHRSAPSWCYHVLLKILFRTRFTDVQCGFKGIRKDAARALLPHVQDDGWFMDAELMIRAERGGFKTAEFPVCWAEDTDSRVRLGRDSWATWRAMLRLKRRLDDETGSLSQ